MPYQLRGFSDPTAHNPPALRNSGVAGVCMMSSKWREEQRPGLISFVSCFLSTNSFRLNVVPIAPVMGNYGKRIEIYTMKFRKKINADFIFNCAGLSIAFLFITQWDRERAVPIFSRVQKLKGQFANLYVVISLPNKEQNESFVRSYFENGMEIGRPTFIPVQDLEMGFEKIVKIAHARGACKRNDVTSKMKAERKQAVQGMDLYLKVVTSIPGISNHDAIALNQTIGSIEAISKASKERILENTDLSADKADTITRFFRDPEFYLSPKLG